MISPGVLFLSFFFLISFFRLFGQKIAQNEKSQLHLSCAISQEHYSLWSLFLVHLCKMMLSPGVCFIIVFFSSFFQKLKRAKNGLKWEKILSVAFNILGIIHRMIFIFGTSFIVHMCKMTISLGVFFILSKFWSSALLEG